MKFNKIILGGTAILLSAGMATAQRNFNQLQFKKKSYDNNKSQFEMQSLNNELLPASGFLKQNYGNTIYYQKENEMIFEVTSLYNAKASKFLAVFNITQVGETAAKTNELINARISGFLTELNNMGIPKGNIYQDMIYMVPTYEFNVEKKLFSKTYNEVPTGFEMQKNIHVSFTDINLVEQMVTKAAKNEIYDLVKLDFFIDNTDEKYDTLRSKSVSYLKKVTESFKDVGITFDKEYKTVKEAKRSIYPETQYPMYDAFVSQSLEAAKRKDVTKLRKPKTVAYDQIPYNTFDIIVNPEILEPVVQLVYKVQIKYTLKKPVIEDKPQYKYRIITENGTIRDLPLE